MKTIIYRAWTCKKGIGKMLYFRLRDIITTGKFAYAPDGVTCIDCDDNSHDNFMPSTGLKDKNGLDFIYEGDIIDENGFIKGNIYENKKVYKEGIDIIVTGLCTKNWRDTEEEIIKRGCKYA